MNNVRNNWLLGMTLVSGIAAVGSAQAHPGGQANAGYLGDGKGHLVTSGSGECIKTMAWTPELALPECDPGVASKKVEAPKPADAPAPAPAPAVAEKITLKAGALFDVGKADLKAAGQRELDELAARLKGVSNIESISITGHTDNQGDAAFNQKLSEQRAASVKNYLVSKGVDGSKIVTSGKGAAQPAASNATADGRAQNRRVEIDIKASK